MRFYIIILTLNENFIYEKHMIINLLIFFFFIKIISLNKQIKIIVRIFLNW